MIKKPQQNHEKPRIIYLNPQHVTAQREREKIRGKIIKPAQKRGK